MKLPYFIKLFIVDLDALDVALRAVLLQKYDERLHYMVYFSNKYIPAERNYASHDKELLEIFKDYQNWRYYLDRHQTMVFTNCKPLVYLHT